MMQNWVLTKLLFCLVFAFSPPLLLVAVVLSCMHSIMLELGCGCHLSFMVLLFSIFSPSKANYKAYTHPFTHCCVEKVSFLID
jgi:hypothetical protein